MDFFPVRFVNEFHLVKMAAEGGEIAIIKSMSDKLIADVLEAVLMYY